jgi:hypothetical protein
MKNFATMLISRGNRRRGRRRRKEIQRVQNEPNEAREESESDECRRQSRSLLFLFAAEITHVHATTKVSFAVVDDDDGL